MATDDRKVAWRLEATGGKAAAAEMASVGTQLKAMDNQSRVAATRFTGLAAASSAMGTSLSMAVPQIGGLATAFGSAGGAVSGMVTVLGGVGGLAAGGLIAAVAVAIRYFTDATKEAEALENQLKNTKTEAEKLAEALSELQKKAQAQALSSQLALGVASQQAHQAAADLATKTLVDLNKQLEEVNKNSEDFVKISGQIAVETNKRIVQERFAATALDEYNRSQLEFFDQIGAAGDKAEKSATKVGRAMGGTPTGGVRSPEVGAATGELKRESEAAARDAQAAEDIYEALYGRKSELHELSLQDEFDRDSLKFEQDLEFLEEEVNAHKAAAREHEQIDKRVTAQALANRQRETQAWLDFAAVGPTAALNALYELAKGGEVNAAAMIESIGDQLWAQGLSHILLAASYGFIPAMWGFAGPLAAVGAVEIATGLTMGAAGASMGGGGGGGGGASPAAARPTGGADQRGGGGDAEGPLVIHVHTLTPTADAGRAIGKAVSYARKKGGKGSVQGLVEAAKP